MFLHKRPTALIGLLLLALLVLASCGNPINKRGRQNRDGNDTTGQQVEQPDDGSDAGSGTDDASDNPGDDDIVERGGRGAQSKGGGGGGNTSNSGYNGESAKSLLAAMSDEHPRLMLDDTRLAKLDRQRKGDKVLSKLIRDGINSANKYLKAAPVKYTSKGPQALQQAHEALKRCYALGFAWRATKDERYVKKLEENLLNICGFKNWTPDHFLATAEFAHAVGIGYDWGFSGISKESRAKIRAGLLKNGLNPGLKDMKSVPMVDWVKTEYNWNFVCNGGLVIGALAIAEHEPKIAEEILDFAKDNLVKTYETYGPDGAWPEGPGYWSYATQYAVYTLAAMQTCLGADFGLSSIKGFADTGLFAVSMTSQSGNLAAFADVEGGASRKAIPVLFWLAEFYDKPELAAEELAYIEHNKGSIQHILWYPGVNAIKADRPRPELDTCYDGKVELMFMRGGYDKMDLFVPFKAGFNKVHHGHLDLGNFELEALGVRWARDLGSDNYGLPGYWESRPGGRRWSHYRLGSFSHNVLTFGGEQQQVKATSKFIRQTPGKADPFGIVEITDAYPSFTGNIQRGVRLIEDRKAVVVQDEYKLLKSTEVTWGITTDAEITLQGNKARLKQKGKNMVVTILSPKGATFTTEAAPTKSGAKSNKGVSRLLMKVKQETGAQTIVVQFSPVWPTGGEVKLANVVPLAKW
ncbi:MAG: heparinase II/III family protein [Planctomycetes bacterium]|nr:heparinase II/III family protein [Planctomycetota bacterium]